MFKGLTYFFDLLDVAPIWPTIIIVGLVILCMIPYKPLYKIKKTKDEKNNTMYVVYKHR